MRVQEGVYLSGTELEDYARGMPKCELHVHLEGTLPPTGRCPSSRSPCDNEHDISTRGDGGEEVVVGLGKRGNEQFEFKDLRSFLDAYYEGVNKLLTEEDYYNMSITYFEKASEDSVRHAECFFDPQTHTNRGIPFKSVVAGIRKGQEEAREKLGITSKLIMCLLRDHSVESALCTIAEAKQCKEWIDAIGLDSNEVGYPCAPFKDVFEEARNVGWKTVAHAGEEGPSSNIWEALDILRVSRVDHGVKCTADPALLRRLATQKIPLTVCPLSNVRLRVVPSLSAHPLLHKELILGNSESSIKQKNISEGLKTGIVDDDILHSGLNISINSDDPAFFGGYVNENYLSCIREGSLRWDDRVVRTLAENSVRASFLDMTDKDRLLGEIDIYHREFMMMRRRKTADSEPEGQVTRL
eukprot:GHVQ01026553.1.p1 GENE.GHVQ01026553.1~~GHVQ01026553.1.p1  ORF type:complete len:412 (+),score=58.57 GHVQ01026553.1:1319-2554(+)